MRKTEERAVSGFEQVILKDIGEVIITQGERESLLVEAEEDVLPRIQTDVIDGRLVIGIKGDWLNRLSVGIGQISTGAIRFHLRARQVTGLEVHGAGNIRAERLDAPSLALKLSGAGSIEIGGLSSRDLRVLLSGAGKVELEGSAEAQEVELSGTGSYQALRLETKRGKVHVSGVGGAAVNVSDELEARISGLGGVQYKGDPRLQTSISGLGRLTKVS
jgi:hypothetical protein